VSVVVSGRRCFGVLVVLVVPSIAWAGGFANLDVGAQRCAMMAITAHADDATAIFSNPACLVDQKGDRIYFSNTNFLFKGRFKIRDREFNESHWIEPDKYYGVSPFVGVTSDFDTERWVFGLGWYFPNAYAAFLAEKEVSRYSVVEGYFVTMYVTPTVAYQVSPKLSLGLGLSYIYVQLYGSRRLHGDVLLGDPLLSEYPDPEEDWLFEVKTDDHLFGWDVGLLWKPSQRWQLGLTYTSEATITMSGEAKVSDVNPEVNPEIDLVALLVAMYGRKFDVTVGMLVPQSLRGGLLFRISDRLDVAFDMVWWDYSRYQRQEVTTDPDISSLIDLSAEKNYSDSTHYDLGFAWHHDEATTLMLGFQYDISPIPDESYSFENPASDLYGYSLGARRRFGSHWAATLAWVNNFYEKKDIKSVNSVPNIRPIGEGTMYELAFDVEYRF